MIYKTLTSIIIFALSSGVHGVEVGQLVQGTVAIKGRSDSNIYATFPLVEGEWSVEYSKLRTNSGNSDFKDLSFFQFENGKLKLAAEYSIKVVAAEPSGLMSHAKYSQPYTRMTMEPEFGSKNV
jgi:hypothetical protein